MAQLSVDGRPFLMIDGELHNSSSSGVGYFAEALDGAVSTGVNTVLAPVSWQQFERTEGKYDFSLTDELLRIETKASAASYKPQTFKVAYLPAEYRVRFYCR